MLSNAGKTFVLFHHSRNIPCTVHGFRNKWEFLSENIYPYCLWLWRSNGWLWYADYSLMYDKWCHAHFLHTKINHCLGQNQMQWNIGMFFTQKRLKSFQDCKGWAILTTALTNLQTETPVFASKSLLEKNATMTKINRILRRLQQALDFYLI